MATKFFKIFALTALATTALSAIDAYAVDTTGSAEATVIAPLTINADQDLSFGTFAADPDNAETVTVDGTGTTTNLALFSAGTQGSFDVTGEADTQYNVTLDNTVNLSDGGSESMSATLNNEGSTGTFTRTVDGTGNDSIAISAVLSVGANQASGTYTGTYSISVDY